jgi:hypothetical protein
MGFERWSGSWHNWHGGEKLQLKVNPFGCKSQIQIHFVLWSISTPRYLPQVHRLNHNFSRIWLIATTLWICALGTLKCKLWWNDWHSATHLQCDHHVAFLASHHWDAFWISGSLHLYNCWQNCQLETRISKFHFLTGLRCSSTFLCPPSPFCKLQTKHLAKKYTLILPTSKDGDRAPSSALHTLLP